MFAKFLIWLLGRDLKPTTRKKLEPCIKELYRRMASENLKIKTEIVRVKKGKRRYDLAFFETPSGKLKVNLGRHWEYEFQAE